MGGDENHVNVSLIARDKVTRQCPQITPFSKRRESRSGIEPKPFCLQPNASPLGHTGSRTSLCSARGGGYIRMVIIIVCLSAAWLYRRGYFACGNPSLDSKPSRTDLTPGSRLGPSTGVPDFIILTLSDRRLAPTQITTLNCLGSFLFSSLAALRVGRIYGERPFLGVIALVFIKMRKISGVGGWVGVVFFFLFFSHCFLLLLLLGLLSVEFVWCEEDCF